MADQTKPGDRQQERNRDFRKNAGSSPNGVANAWLKLMTGKPVAVTLKDTVICTGKLIAFDAYSLLVDVGSDSNSYRLVFKGPGIVVAPE